PQNSDVAKVQSRIEPSDHAPAGAVGRSVGDFSSVPLDDEEAVEAINLSDSLMQFAADSDRTAYAQHETELGSARFDIIDDQDDTYGIGVSPEAHDAILRLVDTSRWFEHRDTDSEDGSDEYLEEQEDISLYETSAADIFAEDADVPSFDPPLIDSSSPNGYAAGA